MPDSLALEIPHSPIAALGTVTLLIAFVVAGYTAAIGVIGASRDRSNMIRSSVLGLHAFTGLLTLASALMVYAFVTHDYAIKYVAHYSDTTMPFWYKVTAYWGGLKGSMLFWVFVLSVFGSIAVHVNRHRHRDMMGYVVATIMATQVFFLAVIIYSKNPFETYLTGVPLDGKGLNPLLQNYWMVIHPPALYVGFVAATIPFAFCIGALAAGRLDDSWIYSVRVWVLICWFALSLGLILGGRWAYEELGWGGYWAWDPVENAGLLPWFTATAVLHSIIIQEQRGSMKVWNVVLVVLTFFLTIFGTFMTRTGVVQSVHAFGEDNELALLFVLFMALIFVVSFALLIYRLPALRSKTTFDSWLSREFSFLLNNWILLGCMIFVLFATMFPTLSEAVRNQRITVGPPFFNRWMVPTAIILLFLAGAAPLLAWRRTAPDRLRNQFLFPVAATALTMGFLALVFPRTLVTTSIFSAKIHLPITILNFGVVTFTLASCLQEFGKGLRVRRKRTGSDPVTSLVGLILTKRRRYGGYVIHMGVALMFIGFAGKAFETEKDFTLSRIGETITVGDYTLRYDDFVKTNDDHKTAWTAVVALSRDGEHVTTLRPARWEFAKAPDQPTTEPAISMHGADDVYLALLGFDERRKVVNFRLFLNPLINWVWLGFMVLMVGTAICLIPAAVAERFRTAPRSRSGKAAETAVLLLVVGLSSFGAVRAARGQSTGTPPSRPNVAPGPVYQEQRPSHAGESAAHLYRPEEAGPNGEAVARKLMGRLPACMCKGCPKEPIVSCQCGFAAQERQQVLALMSRYDLTSEEGRTAAYDGVRAAFLKEYGQEVLVSPTETGFNMLAWLIPVLALAGGLGVILGVGRKWVRRGRSEARVAEATAMGVEEEDEYADILDDELADSE